VRLTWRFSAFCCRLSSRLDMAWCRRAICSCRLALSLRAMTVCCPWLSEQWLLRLISAERPCASRLRPSRSHCTLSSVRAPVQAASLQADPDASLQPDPHSAVAGGKGPVLQALWWWCWPDTRSLYRLILFASPLLRLRHGSLQGHDTAPAGPQHKHCFVCYSWRADALRLSRSARLRTSRPPGCQGDGRFICRADRSWAGLT